MPLAIPNSLHLDTLYDAGVLCAVCERQPWTQQARSCNALICADCAQGEPDDDEASPPTGPRGPHRGDPDGS
jgi:hypothetical protein